MAIEPIPAACPSSAKKSCIENSHGAPMLRLQFPNGDTLFGSPATMGGEPSSAWTDEKSAQDQSLLRYLPRYRRVAFDPRGHRSFPSVTSASAAILRSDI